MRLYVLTGSETLFLSKIITKIDTEQGSRDGAVVRVLTSQQRGPGSISGLGVICGFVVGSRPCFGYSGFPLSPKTNTSKFQFDLESVPN